MYEPVIIAFEKVSAESSFFVDNTDGEGQIVSVHNPRIGMITFDMPERFVLCYKKPDKEYRLIDDNEGRWFIIPVDKTQEYQKYLEDVNNYYWSNSIEECPKRPEWAVYAGETLSSLIFTDYRMEE